jgi:hypothetical protein
MQLSIWMADNHIVLILRKSTPTSDSGHGTVDKKEERKYISSDHDKEASNSVPLAKMDLISQALEAQIPVPVSLLSALSKGSLRKVFENAPSDVDVSRILSLWPKLLLTAKSPKVVDKHMTAAANALCVYLNGASASSMLEIRDFALSRNPWLDTFQCAQKAFDDGKTKPAFQLLETLCDVMQKMTDREAATGMLSEATLPFIRTILLASPRSDLKKACLMLSCFHRKTNIPDKLESLVQRSLNEHHQPWVQRLVEHNIAPVDVSDLGHGSMTSLFLALIFASLDLDTRTAALRLGSVLCDHDSQTASQPSLQKLLEKVTELYLEKNHAAMGGFAQNVLPVILNDKTKFIAFVGPYVSSCHKDGSRMALFLATLGVGRAKNLLSEEGMYECSRLV